MSIPKLPRLPKLNKALRAETKPVQSPALSTKGEYAPKVVPTLNKGKSVGVLKRSKGKAKGFL